MELEWPETPFLANAKLSGYSFSLSSYSSHLLLQLIATFNDVEFMTAGEKDKVLRQWKTFLKHGLQFKHFTKSLYNHIIQHCSFIAHYNRQGFYDTYFETPTDTIRFFRQFDRDSGHESVEYGGAWWLNGDYEDINKAMCETFDPYKKRFYEHLSITQRDQDLSQARALASKHGVAVSF